MKSVIIDASVAIKWYYEEPPLSNEAKAILARLEMGELRGIVPELFFLEFASASLKRIKRGMISVTKATQVHDTVCSFPLERYPDHELSDVAFENALRYEISVYDGVYLALAEIYGEPLITADQSLIRACEGKFDWIEYLGDLKC